MSIFRKRKRETPVPVIKPSIRMNGAVAFYFGDGPFLHVQGDVSADIRNISLFGSAPMLWQMIRLWWDLRRYHRAKHIVDQGVSLR